MTQKLSSQRGETLIEALGAIVICTLSVALLFGSILASVKIDLTARDLDALHYAALSAAEARTDYEAPDGSTAEPDDSKKVQVKNNNNGATHDIGITLYGGESLYAYAFRAEGTP